MNQRDLELLSSYLDGQLGPSDVSQLEARLKTDLQLVSVLNDLRATRSLLRKLPKRRAPRNFTLTRKMVGLNPPMPRAYPIFKFASVLATLLLVFSFGLNSVSRFTASYPYGVGGGMGGGGDQSVNSYAEAPAGSTEVPAPAAAAPAATEAPAEPLANLAPLSTQVSTDVADQTRIVETPASKAVGAENVNGLNQPPAESVAQSPNLIPQVWQIILAIVAILSAVLMLILRQMAMGRWK